ncbi:hypothetical protein OZ410_13850 [Robiginitalea sp. M366]|uniref:hypothetical protein n=1 Tax=Robiginitalea aestuariiviva TaxID=3036903 RepID=UPI00240DE689|nr:hypothetical protein [Robiginitalea aestuariiviva]MDG1573408.1 hypothetical protein [Robiginitalea aestuariiviva]
MLQSKFWQAFFALAPFIAIILLFGGYFIFIFSMIGHMDEMEHGGGLPMTTFSVLSGFLVLVLLMVALCLGSLIFYIVHAVKNPNLQQNNLLLVWILLFIFANGIGQFIYWIVEILGKKDTPATP